MMLLFWVVIIAGGYLLYKNFTGAHGRESSGYSPGRERDSLAAEEIARRRYARGEIDRDELQQILDNLQDK
ncbi:MAG: SHOCT domain-containing protein [Halanaerobium sp.]|nr:SHOCT domain-containing protein [Halanaerobium sp.]